MTQQDVILILKKHPEGLTAKEIQRRIHDKGVSISIGTVTVNLRRLRKDNGFVFMFYPEHDRRIKPKYILKEYATKEIIENFVKL